MRIGLAGIDGSHAEDFLRHFNHETGLGDVSVLAIWSHDGDAARVAEIVRFDSSVSVSPTLAALASEVDCVIVGCRDGRLHRAHALAAIAAGCAVFVDKPLATTETDATVIVDAAERAGVPLASASALRWQDDTLALKARLATAARPARLEASGTWYPDNPYGGAIYYAIHTVELVQELLGTAWGDVRRTSDTSVTCLVGGVPVTLTFAPPAEDGSYFAIGAQTANGTHTQRINLPDDYMRPVAARIAEMLKSGVSPLSADELLQPVRMMAAIDAALA